MAKLLELTAVRLPLNPLQTYRVVGLFIRCYKAHVIRWVNKSCDWEHDLCG